MLSLFLQEGFVLFFEISLNIEILLLQIFFLSISTFNFFAYNNHKKDVVIYQELICNTPWLP